MLEFSSLNDSETLSNIMYCITNILVIAKSRHVTIIPHYYCVRENCVRCYIVYQLIQIDRDLISVAVLYLRDRSF